MPLRGRNVVLCGRPAMIQSIARLLAGDGANVYLHAGPAGGDLRRVVAALRRAGVAANPIAGDMASAAAAARFADDTFRSLRSVRSFVLAPQPSQSVAAESGSGSAKSKGSPGPEWHSGAVWHQALSTSLKIPFFLARGMALHMARRGGGRLVIVVSPSHADAVIAGVVRRGMLTMAEGLAKAVAANVRVAIVVVAQVNERRSVPSSDDVAEAVRFLLSKRSLARGTTVNLGGN